MPQSDLKELREFVANVLDYNPNNANYARQVDDLLNQADRMICQEKPFTFINKVVDVPVYKDVSFTALTLTNGTQVVTGPAGSFLGWMAGQEIEVTDSTGAKRTFVINNVVSTTDLRINEDWTDATGAYAATIINRYIDLPEDCTTVLAVARRSQTRTPDDPGLLENLARYEDEWWNLPLGEINLPIYWVFYDPFHLRGPRRNFNLTTAPAVGRGVRTIEFTSTLVFAGRESPHGEIVSISATDTQDIVLTPFAQTTNSGFYKRYYWRSTQYGYNAWRILDDTLGAPGAIMQIAPTDVAARTYQLSVGTLTGSEGLFDDARMLNPDGFRQRIRLYPRQDKDYIFQVRYMVRHQTMQEDNDVSLIPPAHRMIIAYKALADVLVKHDNPSQAELYRKRFEQELLQLEKRYLITPSKRIVKGNWLTNMEPNSFNRYTTLVHT
jgi:hypothetical protein